MISCSEEEYFYKLDSAVIQSTQYLRKIFKQRWKVESGEDWRDEPNYIKAFLNQHCKILLKKAIPFQKKILLEGCSSENWDISLMSLVLLNFGDGKKYKLQNQAVRQLKDLRNDLAHHKSKRLTQSDYCEKLKAFKDSLLTLEVAESEIDKLIVESGVSSSLDDTKRYEKILANAEQFMVSLDFESALQQYSEAIAIPRLSPVLLGEVYEKRAACHLRIRGVQNTDDKHIDQAFIDVEQALKFNKSSWNAHYLKAQCHKAKNNFVEAIRFYELALAISPVQKQIQQELDSCKLLNFTQVTNARLNRDQLPISVSDIFGKRNDESGRKLNIKTVFKSYDSATHPVHLGEMHYYGWEVPQSYKKAVNYFTQADKQGIPAGTYKLGLCYYLGHGVQQDVVKAVEIYKRCAAMDAKKTNSKLEICSPLGFNIGVCNAEKNIGDCYEQGTGVEKSYEKAAIWYTKAMEHGLDAAATSLGILYINGNGLPRNEKMAEMCWKQGLHLGNTVAAELLVDYYSHQLEPEMAWIMLNIAREMGNSKYLEMSDEDFGQDLTMFQSDRCRLEEYVTIFEKQHKVDFKGMTFKQRMIRAEEHLDPNSAKLNINSRNNSCSGQIQNIGKKVMREVGLRSTFGSQTAKEVVETINRVFELNNLLATKNDLSKTDKLKVVNLSYECMLLEDHLNTFIKNVDKLEAIVAELFHETCQQINEEEMKVRLCYVSYNLWSSLKSPDDLYALGILKEGLCKYPDNYGYIRLLIYSLKRRRSYKVALQCVIDALEKFPEKVELYYFKADILMKSGIAEFSEVISAFKLFLDNAPQDHRLVPEAYYEISFAHMEDYNSQKPTNDPDFQNDKKIKLVQENFKCGKEAERDLLPCYLPYEISESQLNVEGFLGKIEEYCHPNSNSEENIVIPLVVQSKSVLNQKEYIKSPVRKSLVLQHRERFKNVMAMVQNQNDIPIDKTVVPETFRQKMAKKLGHLKSITLQEMNPSNDSIYENRILDLTFIDEPVAFINSVQLLAEDDNGDTTRVYVNTFVLTRENVSMEQFGIGSRIAIINPYMGTCAKSKVNGIRIKEPQCIMFLNKVENLCRFCGEENATRKCTKCKRLYCSRECQKLDWKLFQHKLICPFFQKTQN